MARPANMPNAPWRIAVDTGGTFTDCLAVDPAGKTHRAKVLSTSAVRTRVLGAEGDRTIRVDPRFAAYGGALRGMSVRTVPHLQDRAKQACTVLEVDTSRGAIVLSESVRWPEGTVIELFADEEAPILAARLITATPAGAPLPPIRLRLGTTRGTNALLERRGAPTALFITEGFADLLEIGTQQRPDLFALNIIKPAQLYSAVVEVPGRLDHTGRELAALDLDRVAREARRLRAEQYATAAIALMHSWLNPAHEDAVAEVLREAGFRHICRSARLSPSIRILPRAQTAIVDAYLSPMVADYMDRIHEALDPGGSTLHAMASSGGMASARAFSPKDSLLSGPAGGVVGAAAEGIAAGFPRIIAFDMGGTSTDVSRYDGGHDYTFEHQVGDARIMAPALAIESVAAGGGSVCWVDDGTLKVGPRSAGADPGPACYGAGGPLTITDCNLLLGRLDPRGFEIPIDGAPARARAEEIASQLRQQQDTAPSVEALAEGFIQIANARMAEAITLVSTKRGYNPRDHALLCFGGAGGQHACDIAARLGIRAVVVPRDAGLLSASGLQRAEIERFAERQVLALLGDIAPRLPALLRELEHQAASEVRAEVAAHAGICIRRRIATLRLVGQDTGLSLDLGGETRADQISARFRERYAAVYGHEPPDRAIELESLRVIAASGEAETTATPGTRVEHQIALSAVTEARRLYFRGAWSAVRVHARPDIPNASLLHGPALVLDPHSTTLIPPGWMARSDRGGALVLTPESESSQTQTPAVVGAAREEIDTGRLAAIAADMGEMLRRTALSTNVKERLDFSCAILDADGQLIVNAPHIPVHLGALGVCVRRVAETRSLEPGDVVVTNHPGFGGSHLPDVTLITPVFTVEPSGNSALIAYVACRAHHAEIGGTRPGSMPTDARCLAEEGVVIPPMHLLRRGKEQWSSIELLLRGSPYPSRAVEENLADLRAQLAANQRGATELLGFVSANGIAALRDAMSGLTARAQRISRQILVRLAARGSQFHAEERLDDGSPIRVSIQVASGSAVIDFADSGDTHPRNLNATGAIIRSAVMYVLRLMSPEPLPLNEGLLAPVELRIPRGMLNPHFESEPESCPAVAGGNVETSQRVVDTLLKAMNLCACSQGTMNNTTFGNSTFGYYETVCGGAGAGPGFHGASAIHTHMTNTRITDPEVLEHRYPVRLRRFTVRHGSGGPGRYRGGDGVIRELEFLKPCTLSILTQHRATGPFGGAGGEPGARGSQIVVRNDGTVEALLPSDAREMAPGDRFILETPGGGGWEPAPSCR